MRHCYLIDVGTGLDRGRLRSASYKARVTTLRSDPTFISFWDISMAEIHDLGMPSRCAMRSIDCNADVHARLDAQTIYFASSNILDDGSLEDAGYLPSIPAVQA